MVAGRGLLEAEHVLEVADADRFAARGEQAVEDLDPVTVGECLEHALELVGFVIAEVRRSERCAALDHGERRRHAVIVSKKLDLRGVVVTVSVTLKVFDSSRSADVNHANPLPVAVIGAGPVGLAAAAHLLDRGLQPLVFEAGAAVGASIREWGHVRVFSPWEFDVDPVAVELLERHGWAAPDRGRLPDRRRDRRALPGAARGHARDRAGAAAERAGRRGRARRDRQAQGRRPRRGAVRAARRRSRRRAPATWPAR